MSLIKPHIIIPTPGKKLLIIEISRGVSPNLPRRAVNTDMHIASHYAARFY